MLAAQATAWVESILAMSRCMSARSVMAMRETVGSLRAYFILVGVVGVARGIIVIANESNPLDVKVSAGIDFAFSVAFLTVGILLKKLLRDSPGLVKGLLYAAAAVQVVVAVVLLALVHNPIALVVPAIALLIFWYLLVNVNRLSAAAKPPEAVSSGLEP